MEHDREVVRLERVRAHRGNFTLHIDHLSLRPGRIIGVVGANGAGKTTLLRLLAGFEAPDAGRVTVLGADPYVDPVTVRSRLGFMSDDMPVFDLRIDKLFALVSGYYPTWDATFAEALVDRFEIDLRKKASKLSKGQGTRMRLVLALAFRPRVLVLDEPATGLDVGGRQRLLQTVLECMQDPDVTVLISSHQLGDVQRIADELIVLERGHVRAHAPTDEVVHEQESLEETLLRWGVAG